jgi:hypothetical protein
LPYDLHGIITKLYRSGSGLSFNVLLKESIEGQYCSLSMATKPPFESKESKSQAVIVVLPLNPSEGVTAIASELTTAVSAKGSPVFSVTWPAPIPSLEEPPIIVSLLEFDDSLITDLSEADYDALKGLVLAGKRLLWIAKGSNPIMQTASGFIRSLSSENTGNDYSFMLLEESRKRNVFDTTKMIEQILATAEIEKEYIEKDGEIYCSRWIQNRDITALISADRNASHTTSIALSEITGSLTLTKQESEAGLNFVFTSSEIANRHVTENELDIAVRSLLLR